MAKLNRRAFVLVTAGVLVLLLGGAALLWLGPDAEPAGDLAAGPAVGPTTGAPASPTATPDPAMSVVVPGRPGEPATISRADEVTTGASPRYNSLDALYVEMMIPHHTQALQMAALAADRAGDERIRVLADRVRASQVPEILRMRAWLKERGLDKGQTPAGHEHDTMPGMQTPEAMKRLAAARGAAFDRMFVEMMVDHHQGAIEMATNVLRVGVDIAVEEMATSIAAEQAAEINRMRDLLAD